MSEEGLIFQQCNTDRCFVGKVQKIIRTFRGYNNQQSRAHMNTVKRSILSLKIYRYEECKLQYKLQYDYHDRSALQMAAATIFSRLIKRYNNQKDNKIAMQMPTPERREIKFEKIPLSEIQVRNVRSIDEFLSLNLNFKDLKKAVLSEQTLFVVNKPIGK